MRLNDLLKALEDLGEVNYGVAEHLLQKDESGNFSIKPSLPVCFLMDAPKKRKKSKADFFPKCLLLVSVLFV